MPLTMYDYAKKMAPLNAQALSKLSNPVRSFVNGLIAEEAWCVDYFNHSDNRDPNTAGGPCGIGVDVKIYYAPCTTGEYNNWEVLGLKNDTIWASGKRRIALRKEGGVHKMFLANHTGKSIGGMRDNSSYRYNEIDLSK
jgi:hypothetical protein